MRPGIVEQFDARSNKTVVLAARDGIASVSYAGVAYVGNSPTDQWIANIARGEAATCEKEHYGFSGTPPVEWLDLYTFGQRLAVGLRAHPAMRRYASASLEIAIAGFRFRRRRWMYPFIWSVDNDNGRSAFRFRALTERYYALPIPCPGGRRATVERFLSGDLRLGDADRFLYCPAALSEAGGLPAPEGSALVKRLGQEDAAEAEAVMADAIRRMAANGSPVGEDCMSVLISRGSAAITIKYLPAAHAPERVALGHEDPHFLRGIGRHASSLRRMAYSPWLIGPNITASPQRMLSGGGQIEIGGCGVPVTLIAPEDASPRTGLLFTSNTQRRPQRPPNA